MFFSAVSDRFNMMRFGSTQIFCLPNAKGMSLVELLVVVGIMGFLALGMSTLFFNLQKESQSVKEKLASLEAEKALISVFSGDQLCGFTLTDGTVAQPTPNPQTFNVNTLATTVIPLNRIPLSVAPGAPNLARVGEQIAPDLPSLVVQDIRLRNFIATGVPTSFLATVEITFDPTRTVRAVKPVSTQITVLTGPPTGAGVVTVTGCGQPPAASGYLVANQGCPNSCNYTNTTPRPVFVTAWGGASNPCSGQNSYHLAARVDGAIVADAGNTNPIGYKTAYISFFLSPGRTVQMWSAPWYCSWGSGVPTAPFQYSVYAM